MERSVQFLPAEAEAVHVGKIAPGSKRVHAIALWVQVPHPVAFCPTILKLHRYHFEPRIDHSRLHHPEHARCARRHVAYTIAYVRAAIVYAYYNALTVL